MDTLEIPYRPQLWKTLAGIALFGAASVLFGYGAFTGSWLKIRPLGPLDNPTGYLIFFVLSVAMTAGAAYATYLSRTASVPIRLDADTLSAPRFGFSRQPTVVPLREIQGIDLMEVSGTRILTVVSPAARLNLAESMLPARGDLDRLHRALVEAAQRAAGGQLPG